MKTTLVITIDYFIIVFLKSYSLLFFSNHLTRASKTYPNSKGNLKLTVKSLYVWSSY